MFRPQYFSKTPPGFKDTPFTRPVVIGQDPAYQIGPGQFLYDYIIPMDEDFPQIIRSLFVEGNQQNQPTGLQIRLRDAFGNFITDGFIPLYLYAYGAGSTTPDGGSGRAKVFEPELYCPKGSVLIADFYNPGTSVQGLPIFGNPPVQMSGSHSAISMDVYEPGGSGQAAAVFSYGGALYQVLQYIAPPYPGAQGSINVFKSTDGGLTWHGLDTANSPVHSPSFGQPSGGVYFDGLQTITVASTNGEISAALAAPILLQDFNLATATWGAVYGAGSANVYQTNQVYKRSDGSTLVIAVNTVAGGVGSGLRAYVLSAGGSWSSFSLVSLFPGGWTAVCNSATVLDPSTGIIHMFGRASTAGPVTHQYYQQILPNNTVSGFQNLTGLYGNQASPGNPLLLNGNILLGVPNVTVSFATILVGSPISAPVFSVAPSPGINPAQPIPSPGANNAFATPVLATDGTNLWAVFVNSNAESQVWLSVTPNLANPFNDWVGGLVYDDNPPFFAGDGQYPTIAIVGGLPLLTVQGQGTPTNFFLAPSAPASPTEAPGYMGFRGVKRSPEGCA